MWREWKYGFSGWKRWLMQFSAICRLHLTMDDYHRKYGPIFQVKAGPSTLVFLSSGEFIRSMFAHEGKYPKHILPPPWLYFNQKHKIERGLLFMWVLDATLISFHATDTEHQQLRIDSGIWHCSHFLSSPIGHIRQMEKFQIFDSIRYALNYKRKISCLCFSHSRRDDEKWLRYRQPLNNYLLRDTQWFEGLIHETCEQFVSSTIGTSSTKQVDNLEDEIYLWAMNCNLFDHSRRRNTQLRVEFILSYRFLSLFYAL